MGDDPNMAGNSRRWIVREVEKQPAALADRLIDLYQIHRPEPDTDIDETLSALSDLVHAGKVRAIGSSTFPRSRSSSSVGGPSGAGYVRFRSEQPPYSLIVRGIENSVLPTCDRYGMGVLTWSPLAAGWLSGKYQKERATDMTTARARLVTAALDLSLPDNVRKLEVVDGLAGVAREAGLSLTPWPWPSCSPTRP